MIFVEEDSIFLARYNSKLFGKRYSFGSNGKFIKPSSVAIILPYHVSTRV